MTGYAIITNDTPIEGDNGAIAGELPPHIGSFEWPSCKVCGRPQQFQMWLNLPDRETTALLFMCDDDGTDGTWDPETGANALLLCPTDQTPASNPPGPTLTDTLPIGLKLLPIPDTMDSTDYDETIRTLEAIGLTDRPVSWYQDDETPICAACGKKMRLLFQLEEGPMNFGGGSGYAFACDCGHLASKPKFLWQS
jgi:hypothetical protein